MNQCYLCCNEVITAGSHVTHDILHCTLNTLYFSYFTTLYLCFKDMTEVCFLLK